jgi:hypothetical protein
MGDEAASRRVMAKPCGSVTNGVMNIVKIVDAGTGSQKSVEKSLTGRCAARPTSVGGLQRRATPLTPTNTFKTLKIIRVEMLLLIAHQHQATYSKVIRGETKTNDDSASRRAREDCKVQINVDEFTQTSSGERA